MNINYQTQERRRQSIAFPDFATPWPELDEAAANCSRLSGELDAANRGVADATDAIRDAVAADRESGARARVAGRKRPANTEQAEQKARERLTAVEQERDELKLALKFAIDGLTELVEEHKAAWTADVERRSQAARGEILGKALEALREAFAAVGETNQLASFLRGFPSPKIGSGMPSLQLYGKLQDGNRIAWPDVERALRIMAGLEPAPLTRADRLAGRHLKQDKDDGQRMASIERVVSA